MSIQTLHDDNLILIFEMAAELDAPDAYTTFQLGWISLSHVNRRWRLLLLDQPVLWGRVVCEFPSRDAYRTCLYRARAAPLSLKADRDWVQMCTSVEEIASLIPRARKIGFADPAAGVLTLSLEGMALPLLEDLKTVRCHSMNKGLVAPSLRRLSIYTIPFSISAPHLRTLSVVLSTLDSNTHYLPGIVAAFSFLEELTVKFLEPGRCYLTGAADDELARRNNEDRLNAILSDLERGTPPKEMPRLTSLSVSDCDALFIKVLWRSLAVPRTATISVVYGSDAVWRLASAEPMQTYLSYPEYDTLSVTTSTDGREQRCSLHAGESGVAGSCDVTLISSSILYALSASSLDSIFANIRTLHLVDNQKPQAAREGSRLTSGPNTTPLRPNLGAFFSVQCLRLGGPGVVELLLVLSLYNLPKLKTVEFDGTTQPFYDGDAMSDLSRILHARASVPDNTRLGRIVIRGWVPRTERSRIERDVLDLDFHKVADVVTDERIVMLVHADDALAAESGQDQSA
ncbi:unnamed protein product [Peniophora sp. CBMAI 1063]|nr:unnamed protein product [Peniophora sp. CBMAI 1063]